MGTFNIDSDTPSLVSTILPADLPSLTTANLESSVCFHSIAIWYYDRELSTNIKRLIEVKLCQTFETTETFTERTKLMNYLSKELKVLDSTFIICSEYVKELSSLIKDKSKDYNIYELDVKLSQTIKRISNTWTTFNNVDELFHSIEQNLMKTQRRNDVDENILGNEDDAYKTYCPSFGIFNSTSLPKLFHNLNKDSSIFLLFQLLNQIITKMERGKSELEILCRFCRQNFLKNKAQMERITKFQIEYSPNNAIKNYTNETFLFQLLRQIFQNQDTSGIFKCRCYIADLCEQLENKCKPINEDIILYRGKKLSTIVLQQLLHLNESKDLKNKLISLNGFFSTSKNRLVAENFAGIEGQRDGYVSVMFILKIKQEISTEIPYADISEESCKYDEEEYLFSIGSIWKLLTMTYLNGIWEVNLELTNEFDGNLTDHSRLYFTEDNQYSNDNYLFLLAKILHKLGRYSQAGEFYGDLLNKENLDSSLQHLVRLHFATMKIEQGQYNEALEYLKQILKLNPTEENIHSPQVILATKPLSFQAIIFNTMGLLYEQKDDFKAARESFNKALETAGNSNEKATIHYNLGNLEILCGNTEKGEYHLKKAKEPPKNSVLQ